MTQTPNLSPTYSIAEASSSSEKTLDSLPSNGSIEDDDIEPPKKKKKSEKHPGPQTRFDGKHHIPCKENQKNATRCKLEGCQKKSHVYCKKCKVHLCLEPDRNCYEKYHYLDLSDDS